MTETKIGHDKRKMASLWSADGLCSNGSIKMDENQQTLKDLSDITFALLHSDNSQHKIPCY